MKTETNKKNTHTNNGKRRILQFPKNEETKTEIRNRKGNKQNRRSHEQVHTHTDTLTRTHTYIHTRTRI